MVNPSKRLHHNAHEQKCIQNSTWMGRMYIVHVKILLLLMDNRCTTKTTNATTKTMQTTNSKKQPLKIHICSSPERLYSLHRREAKNKKKEKRGGSVRACGGKTENQFVSAALISAEGGRKLTPAAAGSLFAGTEWNVWDCIHYLPRGPWATKDSADITVYKWLCSEAEWMKTRWE